MGASLNGSETFAYILVGFSVMWYPCGSKQTSVTDKEISYNLLNYLDGSMGLNVRAQSFDGKSRGSMIRGDYEYKPYYVYSSNDGQKKK